MPDTDITLFTLNATRELGARVAQSLQVPLSDHEERDFEDGEHKSRPLVSVRGQDVFVIQSLYSDGEQSVNDKMCRLLFFLGAVRDASAARVTAVVPYLAYARKDRKSQTRDPVTTRYVAQLLEAVGIDCIVTLEVHNLAAFQNAFRCQTEHLETDRLFLQYLVPRLRDEPRLAIVSPDVGGIKRADRFRAALSRTLRREVPMAFLRKARTGGVARYGELVGEVADSVVIIIDDLIATGGTLVHAARTCKGAGAREIYAAATHGVFVPPAGDALADPAFDRVLVTDTIPPFRLDSRLIEHKITVLSTAELIAQAIRRMHTGHSVADLLST